MGAWLDAPAEGLGEGFADGGGGGADSGTTMTRLRRSWGPTENALETLSGGGGGGGGGG